MRFIDIAGLSAGLSAAGVALVVFAAKNFVGKLCKGNLLTLTALMSMLIVTLFRQGWLMPLSIFLGGLLSWVVSKVRPEWIVSGSKSSTSEDQTKIATTQKKLASFISMRTGAVLLFTWVGFLIANIVTVKEVRYSKARQMYWFDAFYRSGSLIFGGGQVV